MLEDCYKKLADAIVGQAVKDYVDAFKNDDQSTIEECEKFFKSTNGQLYSRVDADTIINRCRNGVLAFKEKAVPFLEAQEEHKNAFKCPICGGQVNVKHMLSSSKNKIYKYKAKCEVCNFIYD